MKDKEPKSQKVCGKVEGHEKTKHLIYISSRNGIDHDKPNIPRSGKDEDDGRNPFDDFFPQDEGKQNQGGGRTEEDLLNSPNHLETSKVMPVDVPFDHLNDSNSTIVSSNHNRSSYLLQSTSTSMATLIPVDDDRDPFFNFSSNTISLDPKETTSRKRGESPDKDDDDLLGLGTAATDTFTRDSHVSQISQPTSKSESPTKVTKAQDIDQKEEQDFWNSFGFHSRTSDGDGNTGTITNSPVKKKEDESLSLMTSVGERHTDEESFIKNTTTTTMGRHPAESSDTTNSMSSNSQDDEDGIITCAKLPLGGDLYTAEISTPQIGAMFFAYKDVSDSLYCKVDPQTLHSKLDGCEQRPVVAFVQMESSARSCGIRPGHILLEVNGCVVENPQEVLKLAQLKKDGDDGGGICRPIHLRLYNPPQSILPITMAENHHMVQVDSRDVSCPSLPSDWKPKYVVVGGIISKPWILTLYASRADYEITVIQVQSGHPVSANVQQVNLRGSHLHDGDGGGPKAQIRTVHYPNMSKPWHYIVIVPRKGNVIKISHPMKEGLKAVHDGVCRVVGKGRLRPDNRDDCN